MLGNWEIVIGKCGARRSKRGKGTKNDAVMIRRDQNDTTSNNRWIPLNPETSKLRRCQFGLR